MNKNRGFEVMIPKIEKEPESKFKHLISFKLFKKVYNLTLEVTGDD